MSPPGRDFCDLVIVRRYGILLVDWTIPGQAVFVGKAKSTEALAKIVSDLQAKGFMIFYGLAKWWIRPLKQG